MVAYEFVLEERLGTKQSYLKYVTVFILILEHVFTPEWSLVKTYF